MRTGQKGRNQGEKPERGDKKRKWEGEETSRGKVERKEGGVKAVPEGGVRVGVHVCVQIQSGAAGFEADGTGQKLLLRAAARHRLVRRHVLRHLDTQQLVILTEQTPPPPDSRRSRWCFYLLVGRLLSALLLEALPPLHGRTAAFGGRGGTDGEQAAGRVLLVNLHVSETRNEGRRRLHVIEKPKRPAESALT